MVRDLGRESANTRGMRFIPLSDHAGEMLRQARRSRGGEIDYLLIGPTGLFAIEVKYVNGAFRIPPEQWLYRRSDGYGNEVGDAILLADRGGRPPPVPVGRL